VRTGSAGQHFCGGKQRTEGGQGDGDDTAMNGLTMMCCDMYGTRHDSVTLTAGHWGGWGAEVMCPGNTPVVGFKMRREGNQGDGDDTAANGIVIDCMTGSVQPCSTCAAGKKGASGCGCSANPCTACPAGQSQGAGGQTGCTGCVPGKYAPSSSSRSCTNCPPGKVQPNGGRSNCIACAKGKHQTGTGQTICPICSAGKYAGSTGNVHCTECTASTWIRNPGNSAGEHDSANDCTTEKGKCDGNTDLSDANLLSDSWGSSRTAKKRFHLVVCLRPRSVVISLAPTSDCTKETRQVFRRSATRFRPAASAIQSTAARTVKSGPRGDRP
jgi:hypothetical protein